MKPQFFGYFHFENKPAHKLTRERVAYLLRAARSRNCRRPGNVQKRRNGYFIADSNHSIEKR